MKEWPILFSGEMVKAILDGRKTQTRRVMRGQPYTLRSEGWGFPTRKGGFVSQKMILADCPYGVPGDRLWVREAWQAWKEYDHLPPRDIPRHSVNYPALTDNRWDSRYRHARFMPRWASRITLEITDVRVQRVQEINEEDAIAEGVERGFIEGYWRYYCVKPIDEAVAMPAFTARDSFVSLWDSINARRGHGWDKNPWVWAISFKRVQS